MTEDGAFLCFFPSGTGTSKETEKTLSAVALLVVFTLPNLEVHLKRGLLVEVLSRRGYDNSLYVLFAYHPGSNRKTDVKGHNGILYSN